MASKVAFAPGSFWLGAMRDADNRTVLEGMLSTYGGTPARFEAVSLAPGAAAGRTLAEQREAEAKDAWQDTERNARDHAGIRSAVDILGATLRSVEPAHS